VLEITMTEYIRAKIKNRAQFKQVFPLPVDGEDVPEVGKFILSIIGQTIPVRKLRSNTGSFYYVSELDSRWVIMPNWIDYLDTDALVPVEVGVCVEPLVVGDGVVVVLGR
jgi:hypothetical protein